MTRNLSVEPWVYDHESTTLTREKLFFLAKTLESASKSVQAQHAIVQPLDKPYN
jgi:hypothetical protein